MVLLRMLKNKKINLLAVSKSISGLSCLFPFLEVITSTISSFSLRFDFLKDHSTRTALGGSQLTLR